MKFRARPPRSSYHELELSTISRAFYTIFLASFACRAFLVTLSALEFVIIAMQSNVSGRMTDRPSIAF